MWRQFTNARLQVIGRAKFAGSFFNFRFTQCGGLHNVESDVELIRAWTERIMDMHFIDIKKRLKICFPLSVFILVSLI